MNNDIEELQNELIVLDDCLSVGEYAVVVKNVPEFINRVESAANAMGCRITKGLVSYFKLETFHSHFQKLEERFRTHC